MVKSFPGVVLIGLLCVGLVTSEITVTFEPYNETEQGTPYGRNPENLQGNTASQIHDEEDVETFYVQSGLADGDERRGDIPITHTHSPIKEPVEQQTETTPTIQTFNCPQVEPSKPCPKCCQQSNPPTYINYPTHPLYPYWGGGGSHASVIDDETEYINGGGGGSQVIFITQPQQPDFPQLPELAPLPEFLPPQQQQPSHPSIIYIPYGESTPTGPNQLPGFEDEQFGGGVGTGEIGGGGFGEGFIGGSPHRNHDLIWKQHQQQHQYWLQRQQQQQQNQFGHLIIGNGGVSSIGNLGSVGTITGGGQRPCDSKK